jgi:hypothetical protein
MERFVTVGMLNFGRDLLLDFGRVYADFLNTPRKIRLLSVRPILDLRNAVHCRDNGFVSRSTS